MSEIRKNGNVMVKRAKKDQKGQKVGNNKRGSGFELDVLIQGLERTISSPKADLAVDGSVGLIGLSCMVGI